MTREEERISTETESKNGRISLTRYLAMFENVRHRSGSRGIGRRKRTISRINCDAVRCHSEPQKR